MEVRLLAVMPEHRHRAVFALLISHLARHFLLQGCDLAVISGTVRQLELYAHLGFRPFGPEVGTGEARYQPMLLTLDAWQSRPALAGVRAKQPALFQPGPVAVAAAVGTAFACDPVSHRSDQFLACMGRVRSNLCRLTGALNVAVMVGTGTLANDAIAAQLQYRDRPGLILSNGEFGDRLAAHARGWKVRHDVVRSQWGESFDWDALRSRVRQTRPAWIWAVVSETSTGATNPLARLRELCNPVGADLCLDAVSAIGLMPVDLRGVWLASTVSGKALGAYPGIAAVFHNGRLAPAGAMPRVVDLRSYEDAGSVPYAHSSNLIAALDVALSAARWQEQFDRVALIDKRLRAQLRACGLPPLVPDEIATPGILTLAIPAGTDSVQLARALRRDGLALAHESAYLRQRNWLQICLMGAFDAAAVERIPHCLAARMRQFSLRPRTTGLSTPPQSKVTTPLEQVI